MSIPAHKVVGDVGKPGQITLCSCGDRPLEQCPGEWEKGCDIGCNEKYVAAVEETSFEQSITRKTECCGNPLRGCVDCPPQKKLTFEEWLDGYYPYHERTAGFEQHWCYNMLRDAFKAGCANCNY